MESLISILIPCRNEGTFIVACLDSVLAFELPPGVQIEILVLDGRSGDETRARIASVAARDKRVFLVDNPGLTTPRALNTGIRSARGQWILRLDAHTAYPPNYLAQSYATARRTGAANCGGICLTQPGAATYSAAIVQALTTHQFGVGNSGFRTGASEGPADTVPFGFFPRALFDEIGFFDERLTRNQDYEFNRRIIAAGHTVWLNPAICSRYFNQPRFSGFLAKQFRQEGPYNPYLWYLAPYAFTWRHAITALFVLGIIGGVALSPFYRGIAFTFLSVLALYALLALFSALQQARRFREARHVVVLPFCFFAYHFVHGLGVLRGLITLLIQRAPVQTTTAPWGGASYRRWTPHWDPGIAPPVRQQAPFIRNEP